MNPRTISSSHSLRVSLESVRLGTAGLDSRRRSMLLRVPETGNWANFPKESITFKDIAFLSAKTGHEFAILRGKKTDILFHGEHYHCLFDDDIMDMLMSGKFRLYAHTHPDYDDIRVSEDDRIFLKEIAQKESIIVSWITGAYNLFSADK